MGLLMPLAQAKGSSGRRNTAPMESRCLGNAAVRMLMSISLLLSKFTADRMLLEPREDRRPDSRRRRLSEFLPAAVAVENADGGRDPFSWAPATSKRAVADHHDGGKDRPVSRCERRASATTLPFCALARFSPSRAPQMAVEVWGRDRNAP